MLHQTARSDGRGVSPVIGVILMVAVATILASVVGVYAFGIGGSIEGRQPPEMSFDYDYDDTNPDSLNVTFELGERVDADRLSVVVTDAGDAEGRYQVTDLGVAEGPVESGASMELNATTTAEPGLDLDEAAVRIVWTSRNTNPDAQSSQTLATWQGPDV